MFKVNCVENNFAIDVELRQKVNVHHRWHRVIGKVQSNLVLLHSYYVNTIDVATLRYAQDEQNKVKFCVAVCHCMQINLFDFVFTCRHSFPPRIWFVPLLFGCSEFFSLSTQYIYYTFANTTFIKAVRNLNRMQKNFHCNGPFVAWQKAMSFKHSNRKLVSIELLNIFTEEKS